MNLNLKFNINIIYFLLFSIINKYIYCRSDSVKPIVGIVTNPLPFDSDETTVSNIYYNYVAWIQSYGIKTLPILYNYSKVELNKIIPKINGILFQGGYRNLHNGYFESQSQLIIDVADSYRKPIWFTCQGFELLYFLLADKDHSVLEESDTMGFLLPLDITTNNSTKIENSKSYNDSKNNNINENENNDLTVLNTAVMYKYLSNEQKELALKGSTSNFHGLAVRPNVHNKYQKIKDTLIITAIETGNDGKEFVASAESRDKSKNNYFAVQFHPEKIGHSKRKQEIEHTSINSLIINYLVGVPYYEEVCKDKTLNQGSNKHNFNSDDEEKKWGVFDISEFKLDKEDTNYIYDSKLKSRYPINEVKEDYSFYKTITYLVLLILLVFFIIYGYKKFASNEYKKKKI